MRTQPRTRPKSTSIIHASGISATAISSSGSSSSSGGGGIASSTHSHSALLNSNGDVLGSGNHTSSNRSSSTTALTGGTGLNCTLMATGGNNTGGTIGMGHYTGPNDSGMYHSSHHHHASSPGKNHSASTRTGMGGSGLLLFRQHHHHLGWRKRARRLSYRVWHCFRVLLLSSAIPFVFMVRFVSKGGHFIRNNPHIIITASTSGTATTTTGGIGTITNTGSGGPGQGGGLVPIHGITMEEQQQQQQGQDHPAIHDGTQHSVVTAMGGSGNEATNYMGMFDFLKDLDLTIEGDTLHGSDVAELHYCDLSNIPWRNFTAWAFPLVNNTLHAIWEQAVEIQHLPVAQQQQWRVDTEQEFILELLEQYATDEHRCDYSLYRPTIHDFQREGKQLQNMFATHNMPNGVGGGMVSTSSSKSRLVMIISAYDDFDQLQALIEAIQQPQNYIIIHLERRCPVGFREQVARLAKIYHNVVVLQFGTVTYRTDSISMINLRILRWVTLDLELEYDFAVLLNGSVFPLVSPDELMKRLTGQGSSPESDDRRDDSISTSDLVNGSEQRRQVWLGELMHNGQVVDSPGHPILERRRLLMTKGDHPKVHKRLPRSSSRLVVSDDIAEHMTRKSVSGNQGIYSHHVVHRLLTSDLVMEIFALSKYGCCASLEERNWVAALSFLGYAQEALEQSVMFQVWGGESSCQSSMKNAILELDSKSCYRIEDPGRIDPSTAYFWGNEMWDQIVDARRRGILFARKFRSDKPSSVALRDRIRTELWGEM